MSSRKKSKGQKGKKTSTASRVSPERVASGGPGNGNAKASPMSGDRGLASRSPAARVVYYDPSKELPSTGGLAALGRDVTSPDDEARYQNRWMFTPAMVLAAVDPESGVTLIRTKDGEVHRVKGEDLEDVNPQAMEGVPDAMSISNLTEASLLHTLRERYNHDQVYTRVGPVLMSINPYKWITGLYDEDTMVKYQRSASMVESGDLEPHLFGVADHAYSQLVEGHLDADTEMNEELKMRKARASNQSIIISGESGSGKTEATKIIMQYLARIASATSREYSISDAPAAPDPPVKLGKKALSGKMPVIVNVGELERKVLSCNPLLESFGNAVTLKNDNSSRFGKFIKIQFDKRGRILGAQIQNYLLEKTRIVHQAKRERSYHIFYQLLAGASSALKRELKLDRGVAGFKSLAGSSIKDGDAQDFELTVECLANIGIEKEGEDGEFGRKDIFTLVAAIMHLLNVGFQKVDGQEGDGCMIDAKTRESLKIASELLGVDTDALEKAMVTKTMTVHGSETTMRQTVEQAYDKTAALGKALYSQLFSWLVAKLNTTISAPESEVWGFIGVLDIYGFEKFNTNSLEQLLINYANEHLQRHFNQHMFEVEQVEYEKEQIDWSYITFNDNKACLELIDGKGGLLSLLDDSQRFATKEANQKFLSSFKQKFGPVASGGGGRGRLMKAGSTFRMGSPAGRENGEGHPHFVVPRFDEDKSFAIKHFAGEVVYDVSEFNQKNRENLTPDTKQLMATSSNRLVLDVRPKPLSPMTAQTAVEVIKVGIEESTDDDDVPTPGRGRGGAGGRTIRSKSVGSQFKDSLAELMGTISRTQPRFIRCIKPNVDKTMRFDGKDVLQQLQYSGTMETIRIRQQGYALRELKDDFLRRYKVLHPEADSVEELVAFLSDMLGVSERDWQIGNSKVFLRNSMSNKLNLMVELRRKYAARVLQRWAILTRNRALVRSVLQPFLMDSVKILRYFRAAEYFRQVLLQRRMSTKLVRWYRVARDRRRFVKMKAAAIVVQVTARRRQAVVQLKIRKEFARASLEKLEASIEECRSKLANAQKAKNYKACPPIMSKIHQLEVFVKFRKEVEKRKASREKEGKQKGGDDSREEVEISILETQWRLADAAENHDFNLCSRLQRDIRELEALRDLYPTLEELRAKIKKTEEDIANFAAVADYGRAGSLQEELVKMEAKVKTMEEEAEAEKQDESFSSMSQKDLEDSMAQTRDELEEAKAQKAFEKCIELQARLTEMKAAADAMPTLEQVEGEVLSAEAEMAMAKARKDYRRAAELSLKLPAMHDRHSALASAIRKAMNRKQLAEEVRRLEGEMRLAKAEKRFSKCSLLQRSLTELHLIFEGLPSAHEIEEEMSELRSTMDVAVSEKRYADAEQYRVKLKELAEEKALALEQEQHSSPNNVTRARQSLGATSPIPLTFPPDTIPSMPEDTLVAPIATTVATTARVASLGAGGSSGDDRSVAKLRPKPAVTLAQDATVAEVCRALAKARTDAALLTGPGGEMTGIVTSIDLVRRVVAKSVNPNSTIVKEVMTPNPISVSSEDGAMEALGIMLEKHFRHLPVRGPHGDVTAVLDIAKCLYDAVSRLQRAAAKESVDEEDAHADGLRISMMMELKKGRGKPSKAAIQSLLEKMFDNGDSGSNGVNLTLRDLLQQHGEQELVHVGNTVRAAGRAIARGRKAVLVLEDGGLVGIFTEKDMLNRVLAKGRGPDTTLVEEVMTPSPDTVLSTMTVLEALQEMHDNKYLHLPVVEESSGKVLGVVAVMEIILAIAGEEGSTGWQALFGSALGAADDFSDSASQTSTGTKNSLRPGPRASIAPSVAPSAVPSVARSVAPSVARSAAPSVARSAAPSVARSVAPSIARSAAPSAARSGLPPMGPRVAPSVASTSRTRQSRRETEGRPVSALKPKAALSLPSYMTILEVAKKMSDFRTDAAILLDQEDRLEGIVTDNDIARRVVAKGLRASTTPVSEVMTANPTMVRMDDKALDCLGIMIERHFRHLPVIDVRGNVAGVLNIAKCLWDAIHRLEKKARRAEEKASAGGGNADLAASVLQVAMSGRGKGRTNAKDLQAILASLLANTGDGEESEPTLGSILSQQSPCFVDEGDTVTSAAIAIAKEKKAVLVLREGCLAGIITPKDIMGRVVAKGLDPDTISLRTVMTSNPDTVPSETTVVEALREMHDNKYLHLPVVDSDQGTVVGVVNVMEIVQAMAGARGSSRWEAFFGSAMDAGDEVSDSASVYSIDRSIRSTGTRGMAAIPRVAATASVAGSTRKQANVRPVSSLRPKPPLCLPEDYTVAQVAEKMAEVRTDAVILLGAQGDMRGIMTDQDVARKVVGQSLDPAWTTVALVMTPNPTCVKATDGALDALAIMIDRHFRHLPVVSGEGTVSGLLNIAKCLYEAIHRLEKKAMKSEAEQGNSGKKQELAASLLKLQAKSTPGKRISLAAMQNLLQGLFDGKEQTLGDILSGQPAPFVQMDENVVAAGKIVAITKKAVLVVDEGRLAGIVTPKDILMRVVAKRLDAVTTPVKDIMTFNPDTVPPGMTVVEALKEMHENKYLHLPVVDDDSLEILGVVGVMEIIRATAGDKGSDRWETFFGEAMDAADDVSDSASYSVARSVGSARQRGTGRGGAASSVAGSARMTPRPSRPASKPVSTLRPRRPVVMSYDGTVLEVATEMTHKRTDAALLTKRGRIVGIVTDHHFTFHVVACDKSPSKTAVRDVMTPDPAMVTMDGSAMEALGLMLRNKTRHLPVTDGQGQVTGILDIAKCLYDAIDRLEKEARKKEAEQAAEGAAAQSGNEESKAMMLGAIINATKAMKGKAKNRALQEMLMMVMSGGVDGAREGASQTLGDVLASKKEAQFVRPRHTVREAASVIAAEKQAVLVVEEDKLEGIFTPKDMMTRVLAKTRNPSTTAVSSVMTPNPEAGNTSMTVVEALQQMCDNRYKHLPVLEKGSGKVVGVVDVMEIITATVGQEGSSGWETFFGSAMDVDDELSDTSRLRIDIPPVPENPPSSNRRDTPLPESEAPVVGRVEEDGEVRSRRQAARSVPAPPSPASPRGNRPPSNRRDTALPERQPPVVGRAGGREGSDSAGEFELREEGWEEMFVYKVNDEAGNLRKFRASASNLERVRQAVANQIKVPEEELVLKVEDDDGDQILLTGDDILHEAVSLARTSSAGALKILASRKLNGVSRAPTAQERSRSIETPVPIPVLVGIGIGAVAGLTLIAILLTRGSKKG